MPKKVTCPECGEDIAGRDILAHRDAHWGPSPPDPRTTPTASKRYNELTAQAQGVPE